MQPNLHQFSLNFKSVESFIALYTWIIVSNTLTTRLLKTKSLKFHNWIMVSMNPFKRSQYS